MRVVEKQGYIRDCSGKSFLIFFPHYNRDFNEKKKMSYEIIQGSRILGRGTERLKSLRQE